jgi:hypothetical protein
MPNKDEEHAEAFDLGVRWSAGAPMPVLLQCEWHTFLAFYTGARDDEIGVVEFYRCVVAILSEPNDESLKAHRLWGKGLDFYAAHVVHNSKWFQAWRVLNGMLWEHDPDAWAGYKHYVFTFHDSTFQCIAKSFEVRKITASMEEVLLQLIPKLVS